MEPTRVLIVDDEPLARETIRLLLDGRPALTIVGECENGQEAIDAIRRTQPDLVFLDVQMPEVDGFGVIRAIGPEQMPIVIFATAYDQYALQAFDAHALDYLIKPYDDERFEQALTRALQRIEQREAGTLSQRLIKLLENTPPTAADTYAERLMIRERDSIRSVRADTIDWIEAAGDYVVLHVGDKTHLMRQTMSRMTEQLDPRRFVRIHRSTIVNIDRIKELKPYFHGDYILYLHDGTELRLSRRYWDEVAQVLGGR